MATVAAPYGLRPVSLMGSQANVGSLRQYRIASAYNTNIFCGDLVSLVVGGTIEKNTGTTTATPVGVFMGVEYQDAIRGLVHTNWWKAGTTVPTGTIAWAYIVDDPDMLFEIQADEAVAQNGIGTNAPLVQNAGNTATGVSRVALDGGSIANSATLPLRIVDYVKRPGSNIGDTYTDLVVRINTHFNRSTTGIAAA